MASGHMNRVKRPDTWLHRPMLQNVKKVLANPEQATHDPTDAGAGVEPRSAKINFCGIFGVVRFSTLQHYPRVSGPARPASQVQKVQQEAFLRGTQAASGFLSIPFSSS